MCVCMYAFVYLLICLFINECIKAELQKVIFAHIQSSFFIAIISIRPIIQNRAHK